MNAILVRPLRQQQRPNAGGQYFSSQSQLPDANLTKAAQLAAFEPMWRRPTTDGSKAAVPAAAMVVVTVTALTCQTWTGADCECHPPAHVSKR